MRMGRRSSPPLLTFFAIQTSRLKTCLGLMSLICRQLGGDNLQVRHLRFYQFDQARIFCVGEFAEVAFTLHSAVVIDDLAYDAARCGTPEMDSAEEGLHGTIIPKTSLKYCHVLAYVALVI